MKYMQFHLRFWLLPLILLVGLQQQVNAQCAAPVFTSAPNQGDTITLTAHQFSCEASYSFSFSASTQTWVSYNITLSGATAFSASNPFGSFSFSAYKLGITTVKLEAVNNCGSDVRTFYIQTLDKSAPLISGPSSLTIYGNCPQNATSVLNSNYIIVESCTSKTASISPSTISIGGANYTITAVDGFGNTSTKTVYIDLLAPEIEVLNGNVSIVDNDTIPATTDGTDWGTLQPYKIYTKAYTVKNTGTDSLSVGTVSLANPTSDGGFSISGSAFPRKLGPGQSANFTIKFLTSNSSGNPTVDIVIQNNDCDEGTYNFRLTANVVCPSVSLTVPTDTVHRNTNSGGCKASYSVNTNVSAGGALAIDYYQYVLSGATTASFNSLYFFNGDFNVGVTKVQVTAYNICGSSDQKTFYVKVKDNFPPYISVSPLTLTTESGCSVSKSRISNPFYFDNCGIANVSNDAPSALTAGIWTVKWTATDVHGNTSTADQTVTVLDVIKPTIIAPAMVTVSADNGSCAATNVSLGTPVTSDNCGVDSVWNDAPASFQLGTTTVTWTVKDVNGNTNTAAQSVTVTDNQHPVITVANTVTHYLTSGCTVTGAALGLTQATDNCGIDTVTYNPTVFSAGVTQTTITAKDIHGNTSTKTIQVQVLANNIEVSGNMIIIDKGDTTPTTSDNTDFGTVAYQGTTTRTFTITNIGDAYLYVNSVSITNNTNSSFSIVSGATGNALAAGQSLDITVKYSGNKGGTNTATLVVNNSSCNKSSYNFAVKGMTTCPPMAFETLSSIFVNNDPGVCGATRTWNVTLNSPLSTTLSYVFSGATTGSGSGSGSGSFFNIGTTNIITTATNSCETVTKLSSIHVNDTEKPVITAPFDAIASADIGSCYASNVSLGTPTVSDNCGVDSFWNDAPSKYPVGVTTVTWTVRDIYSKTSTATQNVHVSSFQPPVITAPATVTVNADNGNCSASNVALGTPSTTSVCGIDSLWNNAPSVFPVGNTTVTWSAKDINGNTATATQTVTVIDNQKPDIFAPEDIYQYADSGVCYKTINGLGAPTSGDNCGILSETHNGTGTYPVGTTVITWTVTDIHGNTNTATQNVTIVDNQAPNLTLPPDLMIPADNGNCYAASVDLGLSFASDNCGIDSVWNNAPASFPVGETQVTWTAKDIHGNIKTEIQNITVMDDQNPTITAPAAVTVNADNGSCAATNVVLGTPITADNCGVDSVWNDALSSYPVGSTTVTWKVRDIHGNISTATQTVTVIDNQKPDILAPEDIYQYADSGVCYKTINGLGAPTSGDNCGILSETHNGTGTYPVGTTVITWTVTDIHGNTNTATQNVTIVDNQAPNLTLPPDLMIPADNGNCYAASVDLGLSFASDNCGIDSVWSNAPASFPVGTTTVTWTAKDIHGNLTTDIQNITVMDDQNPTITAPANVTVNADNGNCAATNVVLGTPATADNCGVDSIYNNAPASFPVGTTTVVWTVIDIHSNTSTATQTVTVIDNQKPDITAPISVIVNADFGKCYATGVDLDIPTTGDNCGILSETNDAPSSFPVGTTTVTWTVTDIHGNTNTATQTVTVIDNQNPTITSPASITVNANNGICGATNVALGTPITEDNCAVDSVWNDAPALLPVGTTTVTWTVKDVHGNSSIATQTVTVVDNKNPTITAPTAITVNADFGQCSAIGVSLGSPTTADNCGVDSLWNNALASYPVGTTTVTWTVKDIHGNTSTATQDVTVIDNQDPTITAPTAITVNPVVGQCSATGVQLGTPTTADNCGIDSVWNDAPSSYSVGTTTVTWTVKDIHGNTSTATQDVTVVDNQAPIATCKNYAVTLSNGSATISPADIDNGSTDNCGIDYMTLSDSTFTCSDAGENQVVLTVYDIHGNSASCTATVTVPAAPSVSVATTPANNTYTGGNPNNIYLGYGSQSATISAAGSGAGSYSYSWSPAVGLSCTNCQSPVFTPTTPGNYTYVVTATNEGGCTATATVSFCVLDVREYKNNGSLSGKIYVCIPKNNGSFQTKAVQPSHVAGHLQSGARLGKCDESCGSSAKGGKPVVQEDENEEIPSLEELSVQLQAKVYPNPTTGTFKVELPEQVTGGQVIIRDITGKLIKRASFPHDAQLIFDLTEVADGVYMIEVQNSDKVYRERVIIKR